MGCGRLTKVGRITPWNQSRCLNTLTIQLIMFFKDRQLEYESEVQQTEEEFEFNDSKA